MITRIELAAYLHNYLACDAFNDYAPNGLQVQGHSTIKRIATAVTASEDVIKTAVAQKADALLVHHGYFWRGEDPVITGMKHARLGLLLAHDLNLFAYHLPLDCHPDVGNNACLGRLLDVDEVRGHLVGKTKDLLWSGVLSAPIRAEAFAVNIQEKLKRPPLLVSGTDKLIHRIAWCSGAAQDYIEEASLLGVDAYLSGEISERTYYQAKELGLYYYSCGHHATERYGIQALGQHLSEHFDLVHQFIDSENPV